MPLEKWCPIILILHSSYLMKRYAWLSSTVYSWLQGFLIETRLDVLNSLKSYFWRATGGKMGMLRKYMWVERMGLRLGIIFE